VVTELSLRRLGMEFFYQNGLPSYRGPSRHVKPMREEFARREKLFRAAYAPGVMVQITNKPVPRFGHCMTCADEMEGHRSGMCYLCIVAWRVVVNENRIGSASKFTLALDSK
jgi:hypothetical protein